MQIISKTLLGWVCYSLRYCCSWGSQALYAKLDRTEFHPVRITDADKLDENAKEGAGGRHHAPDAL